MVLIEKNRRENVPLGGHGGVDQPNPQQKTRSWALIMRVEIFKLARKNTRRFRFVAGSMGECIIFKVVATFVLWMCRTSDAGSSPSRRPEFTRVHTGARCVFGGRL